MGETQIFKSEMRGRVPVTVLKVEGELGQESYEQLQNQAREAYDAGSQNILLDLSKVSFMSSSGLRAIHYIFALLRDETPADGEAAVQKGIAAGTYKSPHLKLLKPSSRVHQVLKASGFDMFLEIHSDLKKAIASF